MHLFAKYVPFCLLLISGVIASSGCASWRREAGAVPLARSLQEIVPHGDRDHFVYVWQRVDEGQPGAGGVQVQHVTALQDGEFEVTLSENGVAMGRMRYSDDGTTLALRYEEDLARGFRLSYEPPLPQLHVPLLAGKEESSASATMTRVADGLTIGTMPVTQVVSFAPGRTVRSRVGTFDRTVILQMVRTLQSPARSEELKAESVLVPGIGEIQSTGHTPEMTLVHRELACAIIGGHRVGECTDLDKLWEPSGGLSGRR
jgi:hypothetical protein